MRLNDTRMLVKKFGSDTGGGKVNPQRRGKRVAGQAESSGCYEVWSSAAMSGREGAVLGPV